MPESLLPPNASATLRTLEQATATRLEAIPTPLRATWNPQTCPVNLLPWLAWAFGVESWSPAWTEAQQRSAIAASLPVKRQAGTVGAVRSALAGVGLQASLVEWHQLTPPGPAYTFSLTLQLDSGGLSAAQVSQLLATVNHAKNVRSHLAGLHITTQAQAPLWLGAHPHISQAIVVNNYQAPAGPPGEWQNPILLMHFDGNLQDSSPNDLGAIGTAVAYSSTGALAGQGLTLGYAEDAEGVRVTSPHLNFGADNFCVEGFRAYGAVLDDLSLLFRLYTGSVELGTAASHFDLMYVAIGGVVGLQGSALISTSPDTTQTFAAAVTVPPNTEGAPFHWAFYRLSNGASFDYYVAAAGQVTQVASHSAQQTVGQEISIRIGSYPYTEWTGPAPTLDELRITRGAAVPYGPANFTPPSAPFTA